MSRIPIPATEQAPSAAQPLLASAKKHIGAVPNLLRILANSPAALEAISASPARSPKAPWTQLRVSASRWRWLK